MSWQSLLNSKGNNNQEHTLFSCNKMNNLSRIHTFNRFIDRHHIYNGLYLGKNHQGKL